MSYMAPILLPDAGTLVAANTTQMPVSNGSLAYSFSTAFPSSLYPIRKRKVKFTVIVHFPLIWFFIIFELNNFYLSRFNWQSKSSYPSLIWMEFYFVRYDCATAVTTFLIHPSSWNLKFENIKFRVYFANFNQKGGVEF